MEKILVQGKYNSAKVYASIVEQEALDQIQKLCNQEWVKDSHIAIMPDTHAGAGCTIGTSMVLNGKVCPNLVGVDIGCGMLVVELGYIDIDFDKFDKAIYNLVPAGSNVHETQIKDFPMLNNIYAPIKDKDYIVRSLGTLGGGNHFIELDKDELDNKYLVIHSGSRHLGVEVAKYWQSVAESKSSLSFEAMSAELIKEYKKEGKFKEIQSALEELKSKYNKPDLSLAYLEGSDYENYLSDMKIAQDYAKMNRELIAERLIEEMGWIKIRSWSTIHNYIDLEHGILRKGAISAYKGEKVIIPMNMRDGSLICFGKGNKEWNCSAPHGAGRLMSRSAARKNLSIEDYNNSMEHIYSSSVSINTIDEAPMAYKPWKVIVEDIQDTVEGIGVIKPIYNFKASN